MPKSVDILIRIIFSILLGCGLVYGFWTIHGTSYLTRAEFLVDQSWLGLFLALLFLLTSSSMSWLGVFLWGGLWATLAWSSLHEPVDPFASRIALAAGLIGSSYFFSFASLSKTLLEFRIALRVIIFSCLAEVAYGYWEIKDQLLEANMVEMDGHFANQDVFGMVPMVGYLLLLGWFRPKNIAGQGLYAVLNLFFLGAVILSGSRSVGLGLIAGTCIFLLFGFLGFSDGYRVTRRLKQWLKATVVPIGLLLVVLSLGSYLDYSGKWSRFYHNLDTQNVTIRKEIYLSSLDLIASQSSGVGLGGFQRIYQNYRPGNPEIEESAFINKAHNDYLELGVEGGWLGLLLFFLLHVGALFIGYRRLKLKSEAIEVLGCIAALGGIFTYVSLNFAWSIPPVFFLWSSILGLLYSRQDDDESFLWGWVGRLGVMIFLVVPLLWSRSVLSRHALVQQRYEEGLRYTKQLDNERAIVAYTKCLKLEPDYTQASLKLSDLFEKQAYLSGDLEDFYRSSQVLKDAIKHDPLNKLARIKLADLLIANTQYQEAEELLVDTINRIPYDGRIKEVLARCYLYQERYEEAADAILKDILSKYIVEDDEYKGRRSLFGLLIYTMEYVQEGRGLAYLDKLSVDGHERIAREGASSALLRAQNQKVGYTEAETRIADWLEQRAKLDLVELRIILISKARQSPEQAQEWFEDLGRTELYQVNAENTAYTQLITTWMELAIKTGRVVQLKEFLRSRFNDGYYSFFEKSILGLVYIKEQEPKRAIDLLKPLVDDKVADAFLFQTLAMAYEEFGEKRLAMTYYEEACAKDPGYKFAKSRAEELKEEIGQFDEP